MKKNIKLAIGIILIILLCGLIFFFFKNTFLYNYEEKLLNYLDDFYIEENSNISNINNLINRYKNNEKKTNEIYDTVLGNINDRINDFNKEYYNFEILEYDKERLESKTLTLIDSISLDMSEKKDGIVSNINNLYESKLNYLNGKKYFEENDYNNAYECFNKVIKSDIYFNDVNQKIDEMFESELTKLENNINELKNKINNDNQNNLDIYIKIIGILKDQKDNTKFDISKSKRYTSLADDTVGNLLELYVIVANTYKNQSNFNKASEILASGIKLITSMSYNVDKLIAIKDDIDKMQPTLLTSLQENVEGASFKEEIAILDKNNKSYASAISVYKNNKGTISYNLNKEYKKLKITIAIGKEVDEKKKNYGKVKISADNKVLYDSKDITKDFKTKDLELNISDISTLKIEYLTSSNKVSTKDNILVVVLGNPTLEKY